MPTPPVLPTWESIEEIVAMLGPASDFRGVKHKEMMEGLIARLKALETPVFPDWNPVATEFDNCVITVISKMYSVKGDLVFFATKFGYEITELSTMAGFAINLPILSFFTSRHDLIAAIAGEINDTSLNKTNFQIDSVGNNMVVQFISDLSGGVFSIVGMYKILPEEIEE